MIKLSFAKLVFFLFNYALPLTLYGGTCYFMAEKAVHRVFFFDYLVVGIFICTFATMIFINSHVR